MAKYLTTDTDLTSVANAIRTKGGTSAPLSYPAGFVSAIGDIPTGGGVDAEPLNVVNNGTYTAPTGKAYSPVVVAIPSPFAYAGRVDAMFQSLTDLPSSLVIDFGGSSSITNYNSIFYNSSGVDEIEIKNLISNSTLCTMRQMFWNCTAKTIKFSNCIIRPTDTYIIIGGTNTVTVIGEFDLSLSTNNTMMIYNAQNLEEIRFAISSIMTSINIGNASKLSNETVVSIANGLSESASGQTVSFTNNVKGRLNAILGYNNGGLFLLDEEGTTNVSDFITNVKGWTIA